jgi:hypothetical protein
LTCQRSPTAWGQGRAASGQQWREAQHPPIDGDIVDLDATLDQEFFDVAIRQAVAEVPAHRQHDDVGWGTEAGEGRAGGWSRTRAASSHAGSLAARRRSPRTQQRPSASCGRHGHATSPPRCAPTPATPPDCCASSASPAQEPTLRRGAEGLDVDVGVSWRPGRQRRAQLTASRAGTAGRPPPQPVRQRRPAPPA